MVVSDTMEMTVRWKVWEPSQIEPENCPSRCETDYKEEMIGARGEFLAESERHIRIEQEEMLYRITLIGVWRMNDRLTTFFRKPIPEKRDMMCEWPVRYFKTKVHCGAFESNGSWGTSSSVRPDMQKIVEIGGFVRLGVF